MIELAGYSTRLSWLASAVADRTLFFLKLNPALVIHCTVSDSRNYPSVLSLLRPTPAGLFVFAVEQTQGLDSSCPQKGSSGDEKPVDTLMSLW